ncbi:hypothetical protein ACFOPN_03940 [Xanthomonas hyacinthi]
MEQSGQRMRRELDGVVLDAIRAAAADAVLVPPIRISRMAPC